MNIRLLTFSKHLKTTRIFDRAGTLNNDVTQVNFCFPRSTLIHIQIHWIHQSIFKHIEKCYSLAMIYHSYASIFPPLLAVVFLFNNFFYKEATFYHLTVIIQDNFKLRTQSRWHWTLAAGWGHAYLRISLPIRGNYFSNTLDISIWTLSHSQVDEIAVKSRTANGSLYFYFHHLYERPKFKSQVSLYCKISLDMT